MYTVTMVRDGERRTVDLHDGLSLVAEKLAAWAPPLLEQMAAAGTGAPGGEEPRDPEPPAHATPTRRK